MRNPAARIATMRRMTIRRMTMFPFMIADWGCEDGLMNEVVLLVKCVGSVGRFVDNGREVGTRR
jgi:hypothetical protein